MQTFELHIEELTKSMNEKFSELESRANNVLPALSQSEIPSQFSNFSFDQTFDLSSDEEIDWDRFKEMIDTNPEEAVLDVINYIRYSLNKKTSAKRLIEKANSQYVDSSFQRVATQQTAKINQSIIKNHNDIKTEIEKIKMEIDDLTDTITHEFDEIKQMIADCRKTREDVKNEDIYQSTYQSKGRLQNSSLTTFNQAKKQQLKQIQLLRPKKTINSTQKSFSATLTNTLQLSKQKKPLAS
ncbi:hypothetical protein M9Y10_041949 [Tritrichomonas musculus]|uniref:Uncharacterized protein n=1 Tax=Tritrichomonas musculus TaxID=1915356 RepID=A0ABR2K6F7_9EUKA